MLEHLLGHYEEISSSWWPYVIALFISFISAVRVYVGGVQYQKPYQMKEKLVVITGGASGIGFETAKNLASRGAHIILAVRNAEKGKKAADKIREIHKTAQVTVKLLDMSELSSIRDFATQIVNEHNSLDVLVNNAAVIYQPYTKTPEGFEQTLVVNYLGPFLLTHLLLPLLNKAENGRIINVSAMAHYNGKLSLSDLNLEQTFNEKDAFSQSKLALTIFTKYLATLLKNTRITCNSVSPGLVRGTKHLNNLPLQRSVWTKMSVWPWIWLFLKTPKQGCQSIVYLSVEPSLEKVSGYYFSDCEIKEPADLVKDVNLALALYQKSCKMLNIDGKKIIEDLIATQEPKQIIEAEEPDSEPGF